MESYMFRRGDEVGIGKGRAKDLPKKGSSKHIYIYIYIYVHASASSRSNPYIFLPPVENQAPIDG